MANQKGSIKDRLRARFLFLQYKTNKKKKEKEELKKKKKLEKQRVKAEQIRLYGRSYNKFQVFGLSIIGILVEIFTPKGSKSNVESKIDIIEKEVKQITLKLEQDKNLEVVMSSIDDTYQKLEDIKKEHKNELVINFFSSKKENKLLDKIDNKQKELILLNDVCKVRQSQKDNAIKINKKILKTKEFQNNEKEVDKSNITVDLSMTKTKTGESFNLLSEVKIINEKLKEQEKEIVLLQEKIDNEKNYNALYDYEFKLKQLKIKMDKILEQYEFIDEHFELEKLDEILDIEILDKYEVRKSNKKILKQLEICHNALAEIEKKKQILSSKKVSETKNVKTFDDIEKTSSKDDKKEKVKLEKENDKIEQKLDDIYLANKIIVDNIVREKKTIDKLKKQIYIQPPMIRKRSIFICARKMTTSILNFGFSLLPIKYFKNRIVGTLVTSIMLNNSLRSVRRVFNHDINYLLYQDIARQISKKQDYIDKNYDVCIDSLNQIKSIRSYLEIHYSDINDYNAEMIGFSSELSQIESQLVAQIKQLETVYMDYENVKQKIKMKEY